MLPNKKYGPKDFITVLWRRLPLLAVPPAVGLLLALIVSSRMPNVYQAETLIQIVPQRVPESYIRSTVTLKTEDRLDAIGQQVTSRTQLERIIEDLNLYAGLREVRPMQDVVELMRRNVHIDLVRPARNLPPEAFYLRFHYDNPSVAARVVERLSTLYIDQNARERGKLAEDARDFLQGRLDEAKAQLDAQDRKLQQFRERHSGTLPSQMQSNMQAIQNMQMQRQATVESIARDRDMKLMRERLYSDALSEPAPLSAAAATSAASADPAAVSTMSARQRLDLAKGAVTRLEARLTENHPDLRRAREQVADLEKQLAAEGRGGAPAAPGVTTEELSRRERISGMRAEIESLDRQIAFKESEERRLTSVIADYQRRIEAVPGVETEWNTLSRDYDSLTTQFNDLLTKNEAAKGAVELERRQVGEQFQVLDAPRGNPRPISPQRIFYSASGLGIGLGLGLLVVLLLEIGDSSLKTEEDVEQILELPVLALVPTVVGVVERHRARRWRALAVSSAAIAVVASGYVFWAMKLWKFVA